jgi:hypothetical protein
MGAKALRQNENCWDSARELDGSGARSYRPGVSGGCSSAWLELQIVDLVVAGSNPVSHPTFQIVADSNVFRVLIHFQATAKRASVRQVATLSRMKCTGSRNGSREVWPRKVRLGRVTVTVYRRAMPYGSPGYLVSNYADGKRRLESYASEADALDAANRLARQLSEREVLAAALTNEQAVEYAAAVHQLAPAKVGLLAAAGTLAEALKHVDDLTGVIAAVKFYAARHQRTTPKRVADAVAELVALKAARGKSERYTISIPQLHYSWLR